MLNTKINELTKLAIEKGFKKSAQSLQYLQQNWGDLQNKFKENPPFHDYFVGALNGLELVLRKDGADDAACKRHMHELWDALKITDELSRKLGKHLYNEDKIADDKIANFKKDLDEEKKLITSIKEKRIRYLSLQDILDLNIRLANILNEYYNEKELPRQKPKSTRATPTANANANTQSQKLGFKFLENLSNLFKEMASPEGNPHRAMQSFAGFIVELVVSAIGDFFKAFLGKEAASQVDKLVDNAGQALHKMFVDPKEDEGHRKSFTPRFEKEKSHAREKTRENEKSHKSRDHKRRKRSHSQ